MKIVCARFLPEKVLFLIKKTYYPHYLKTLTEEEECDIKPLRYLIREGDRVVDIGANIGVYTKFLSGLVGSTGKVYSVEPVPTTFHILCSNVKKLRMRNVFPINYAISNCIGEVSMEVPSYDYGLKNFYQARITNNSSQKDPVTTVGSTTIDSLLSMEKGKIAFIKIDVEGHEYECLQGATGFLKTHRPAWLIEIQTDMEIIGSNATKINKLLTSYGYKAFWFDNNYIRRKRPDDKSINYFFLLERHCDILKSKGVME